MKVRVILSALGIAAAIASAAHAQTTGFTPLNDLGAGTYQGYPGWLYTGGNTPPPAHATFALQRAAQIVPRDGLGVPHPDGWIAMIAVGMSNTTHEFGAFERNEDANPGRNARVVLMDTGFGGQNATVIANPGAAYWTTMQQRLTAMGLTAAQVQVAWLKEAEANPPNDFPGHALRLTDTLVRVVQNLHDKFPNLRVCYVSSRIFGGYSAGGLNPEPQAYESGFSVKWLIERQIAGDAALNHGQLGGAVRAPLLMWGPYTWADGVIPRSDGLVWLRSDLESDGVHPSPAGEQKVAGLLSAFFAAEPSVASWWPPSAGTALVTVNAAADAHVDAANPSTNFGASALLRANGGATPKRIYVRFDASGVDRPVRLAKLSLRVFDAGGGSVALADPGWAENTITWSNAPAPGGTLVTMPQSSRDGTIAANVTAALNADADGVIAFVISSTAMQETNYHSREVDQAPRLVLVVDGPVVPAAPPWALAIAGLALACVAAMAVARARAPRPA